MMNDMKTAFAAAGCTGKEIRFTECGWPTAGAANGKAIPSLENQRIAISKTLEAFPDAILFTAFDDLWKEDRDTTKGTEKVSWLWFPSEAHH